MTFRLTRYWLLAGLTFSSSLLAQTPEAAVPPPPVPSPAVESSPAAPSHPALTTSGQLQAQNPDEPVGPLRMTDTPLELVLLRIEEWTGKTILRPQQLPTPTFTLVTKNPIPKSEALVALETLLTLNQIVLLPMGDKFIKVQPLPQARWETPEMVTGSTLNMPPSGKIIAKLFQLEFLRVNEFLPQINPLLNPNLASTVLFEKSNSALLMDTVSNIQRVELLMQQLDKPISAGMAQKFYTLRYAKASDLVNKIRSILQGPLQQQLGSSTTYTPDDRTNQIILISDPRQQSFFDDLIAKLDVKADPNTRNEVIFLKHAQAKDVASLISQLVSGQTKATSQSGSVRSGNVLLPGQAPTAGPAEGAPPPQVANPVVANALSALSSPSNEFSSLVTILPDERSNAVLVSGTLDDIRLIKELVEKVDIILAQVRIEVVVAEVTLGNNSTSGISSLGLAVQNGKLIGALGSGSGTTVGGLNATAGATTPSGFATATGDLDLNAIISMTTTPRKSNSTVFSVPSISTMHNKEAKIFFGETRPVITGSTSTPTGTTGTSGSLATSSTVTQQEIGTTVTVKPLIGYDGSVQLDIKQTISEVAGEVTVDGNTQYIIGKRETASFLTVKSGEIIVLGGMQKNILSKSTSRLGPVPFIGDLLGTRSRNNQRTELVFFIRPMVLTNTPADNEEALKRLDTLPNKDEVLKKLNPAYQAPEKPLYKKIIGSS